VEVCGGVRGTEGVRETNANRIRACLLLRYFHPERCGDMWGFGVHPILSNLLKYSSQKILYHDGEFLI
jgi:hypothetical protein